MNSCGSNIYRLLNTKLFILSGLSCHTKTAIFNVQKIPRKCVLACSWDNINNNVIGRYELQSRAFIYKRS
jgi:hypothetical protein